MESLGRMQGTQKKSRSGGPDKMTLDKLFLFDLLSQPTSPYREHLVFQCLTTRLRAFKVPHFFDPVGNLVIGPRNKADYARLLGKKSKDPVRIFVAHADHPGFHGEKWLSSRRLQCKWHGGSPTADLLGAKVWVCARDGSLEHATVAESQLAATGNAIASLTIDFGNETFAKEKPASLFGGFSFRRPVWQDGETIYTKAADDLVGAFSIVTLAGELWRARKKEIPFIGLITRAEEVGFIGCIGHLELGWFKKAKRPLLGVSLETSRTLLPGAEIGKGPVVRLGDRMTTFDSTALRVFSDLAARVMPAGTYQRRVMDGGSCEATAMTAYGIKCVGISVPLGNYHNQNFEGGPDARAAFGPAPEFVNIRDIQGLLTLCNALMRENCDWSDPWSTRLKAFKKSLQKARALLR